jgi:hypothetical protein
VTKTGLCKDLEGHVFDYGSSNAANLLQTTQEKIAQYVGTKYRKDIEKELKNKVTVTLPSPSYSSDILARHQEWKAIVRRRQFNLLTALRADFVLLEARRSSGKVLTMEIANLESDIKDKEYKSRQQVPVKLTAAELLDYSNECKSHSYRVAALEKHWRNVYSMIYGQCTQILQDKMKQDKSWVAVSASYNPINLYKLIERVVLKQTEDQYPVAAIWDQMTAVYSAKQGITLVIMSGTRGSPRK